MDSLSDSPASAAEETPAQRQARLRRERRNAKIQAGGSARLQAITSLSGRPAPADEFPSSARPAATTPQPKPVPAPSAHDDPDEVDISQHYYTPASRSLTPSQPPPDLNPFGAAFPQPQNGPGTSNASAEDPMLRMMQQMMGGVGRPGEGDLPPGLAEVLGAMSGQTEQTQPPATSSAAIWRVVHALFSLVLGLYVALFSSFTGSKFSRSQVVEGEADIVGPRLFWLFATAEVVLQSSRYFLERGQLPASGILGTISRALPEPYAGYVRVVGRYSVIYSTVVADAMVVVFVLGCVAWWRGSIEA